MTTKKISAATKLFFEYSFKGDGKYYTTEQGSRHYRNSTFENFYRSNSECIDIIEQGNDAPRGGRTGDFVVVKFNDKFFEKWQPYMNELKAEAVRLSEYRADKEAKINALGNQQELLIAECKKDPQFLQKIKNRIDNFSSKQWRNWVRMKVCQRITNESFELLTLSAPDIRDIAFSL